MRRGKRPASCQLNIGHIKLNGSIGDIPMGILSAAKKAAREAAAKARAAAKAKKLKENQKKPANTLQSLNKTAQSSKGMGTTSSTRVKAGVTNKAVSGKAKTLSDKIIALNNITDKKSEKAQLLKNAIAGLRKNLPNSVIKKSEVAASKKIKLTEGKATTKSMEAYKKDLIKKGTYTAAQVREMDELGMFNRGGMAAKRRK